MLLAQTQKHAAIRLQGYLVYWQGWVIDHDLFGVFHEGVKWNQEIDEILRRGGGAEELVKLKEEKKQLIREVREGVESNDSGFDRSAFVAQIAKLPADAVGSILDYAKNTRQNLIDGKTFISDTEAASLGMSVTQQSIELKMYLLALTDTVIMILLAAVTNPSEFDIKKYSKEISESVWRAVVIAKHIDSLTRAAQRVTSKTILKLTWRNVLREL